MKAQTLIKTYLGRYVRKLLEKMGYGLCKKDVEGLASNFDVCYGYGLSYLDKRPIDKDKGELPWFTYPAIEYISQFDLSDLNVFEWGSGYSSIFFAKRCKNLISIESNASWHNEISQMILPNQKLLLRDENQFPDSIYEFNEKYDIIIIDSLRRYDCAVTAVKCLNQGGLIILDNSDWLPKTTQYLRQFSNFIQVDFHGFGPINQYSWTTSFYLDRNFKLESISERQPSYSKAAIIQVSKHDDPS